MAGRSRRRQGMGGTKGTFVIRARPWLRRQLGERGPLLFWKDGPDGMRIGLACGVDTCRNPGCECREAGLHGFEVNDLLLQVEVPAAGGSFRTVCIPSPTGAPRSKAREVVARLDLDDGELRPGMDGQDEGLLAWLRDEADGELLELLQRRWVLGKGDDPDRMNADLCTDDLDPRGMLSYGVAYPGARDDVYVLGGHRFVAIDLYCPDALRRGTQPEVVFEEVLPGDPAPPTRPVGSIRVSLRDGTGSATPGTPDRRDILDRLWTTCRRRHDIVPRLAERQHRIHEVGAFVLGRPRPGTVVRHG